MAQGIDEHRELAGLLERSLAIADRLGLDFVGVKIVEALDRLRAEIGPARDWS
jgi:hypothetical protein